MYLTDLTPEGVTELSEWELATDATATVFELGGSAWSAARLHVEELVGDTAAAALSDVALARALGRAHADRYRRLSMAASGDPVASQAVNDDHSTWVRQRRRALQALCAPSARLDGSTTVPGAIAVPQSRSTDGTSLAPDLRTA